MDSVKTGKKGKRPETKQKQLAGEEPKQRKGKNDEEDS